MAAPRVPIAELASHAAATCLNFNAKDHNVLGAGLHSGQFGLFDPRKGVGLAEVSPAERSHRYMFLFRVSIFQVKGAGLAKASPAERSRKFTYLFYIEVVK
jgi:hypothetical protein